MTLTEQKRAKFIARYARRDARRMVYVALFGTTNQLQGARTNDPFTDETRRLPYHWTHSNAEKAFNDWIDLAEFSPQRKAMLEQRLDKLRHFKATA